jgi:predicted nuclease of restriction endonuclease-like RecB superfamily
VLTADLAISFRRGRTVRPLELDVSDRELVQMAADLTAIVSANVGEPRSALDRELDDYIGTGTDYRVLRGLIKLLLDRCDFGTQSPVDPSELRREVFARARARHPVGLDGTARAEVLAEAAAAHGIRAVDVEASLYADLVANQRLAAFEPPDSLELLEAYNLAQAQALLYRSVRMDLVVGPLEPAGYRQLFDAIKAYRLIHRIRGDAASGYEVALDGPVSLFHRSQKYGVQMAVFLPALLACEGWRMRAEIDAKPKGRAYYDLDRATTRLAAPADRQPLPRHPAVEKLLGGAFKSDAGWRVEPSGEVVDLGGGAFVPDAVAVREDGARVYVEAIGFWTPQYVAERASALAAARIGPFLFLATEELLATRDAVAPEHPNLVVFKTSLDHKALRAALDRLAGCGDGDPLADASGSDAST